MKKFLLLLNSSVAFALALILTTQIHEFGHAFAALLLGFHPIVHPFSVDTNVITNQQHIITLLAGPFFSLVTGLLLLRIPAVKNSFWRLFILWMGLLSLQTFTGYLMTAPFNNVGDISEALQRMNSPLIVKLLVFAIGAVGMFLIGRHATKKLLRFTNPKEAMSSQLRQLGLFAWLIGTGLVLVLSLDLFDSGAHGIFQVFGQITAGIFLTLVAYFMSRVPVKSESVAYKAPVAGVILLVIVAILRQLIFGTGLHL